MNVRLRIVLASLWTAAVVAGLSYPASQVPAVGIQSIDKIVHLVLFFVLGFLWMAALGMDLNKRTAAVFITGLAFAVATELIQGILPVNREADSLDVLADLIGLVIGIGAYRSIHRRVAAARV